MRHSQLRAFHAVAEHGGFSAAAQALGLSQPALSDQVKKLEQTHDVLLFSRAGRQVELTKAGQALLALTTQYFETESQISTTLSASQVRLTGTLRILADSAHHILPALTRFRAAQPRVFVQLRIGNSEAVLTALRGYEAEIGVLGSHRASADVETVDLGHAPICAMARVGHIDPNQALRFEDLPGMPLIFREQGSRTRAALEAEAMRLAIPLRPVMEVEGREALREVVATGAGIGFVSRAELGHDPRVVAVPLAGFALEMTESAAFLAQRRDVPVIRAFRRALQG